MYWSCAYECVKSNDRSPTIYARPLVLRNRVWGSHIKNKNVLELLEKIIDGNYNENPNTQVIMTTESNNVF